MQAANRKNISRAITPRIGNVPPVQERVHRSHLLLQFIEPIPTFSSFCVFHKSLQKFLSFAMEIVKEYSLIICIGKKFSWRPRHRILDYTKILNEIRTIILTRYVSYISMMFSLLLKLLS